MRKKIISTNQLTSVLTPDILVKFPGTSNLSKLSPADFEMMFGVKYQPELLIEPAARAYISKEAKIYEKLNTNLNLLEKFGKQLDEGYIGPVYLSRTKNMGWGLFASEIINSGELIGEYTGLVREQRKEDNLNRYLLDYHPLDHECLAQKKDCPLNNYSIDAQNVGNYLRFLNHSSKNANAGYFYVSYKEAFHVIFVASRKIRKNEQIFFNYGFMYWASLRSLGIVPVERGVKNKVSRALSSLGFY
ncbi:MAG: SET domain-containing protein-lysine N-methyltransferase [Candidatus Margulisbacteria bacterium]|nr:SET domain-containing protein-lysine N-methyltransferase [Candidatus Margulisiibacteriota bacterium]